MKIEDARRFYAEEIRAVANVQNDALADAFARVRRVRRAFLLIRAAAVAGAGLDGAR